MTAVAVSVIACSCWCSCCCCGGGGRRLLLCNVQRSPNPFHPISFSQTQTQSQKKPDLETPKSNSPQRKSSRQPQKQALPHAARRRSRQEQVFHFRPHELAATAKAAAKLCPEHPGGGLGSRSGLVKTTPVEFGLFWSFFSFQ